MKAAVARPAVLLAGIAIALAGCDPKPKPQEPKTPLVRAPGAAQVASATQRFSTMNGPIASASSGVL
jgi:hypothetical protein